MSFIFCFKNAWLNTTNERDLFSGCHMAVDICIFTNILWNT